MKPVIATIVGIVVAGVAVWVFELLGHLIVPIGKEINISSPEEIREIMFKIPVKSLIAVVVAHGLGLLAGLFTAHKIDGSTKMPLYAVTGIMLLFTVINLVMIPHPIWFTIADIAIMIVMAIAFIGTRKKA